jgi:class 3 adenylate cyclase/predicted ATPase
MEIAAWLRDLGLERYEPTFRENEIDAELLRELTDVDLEKLGLPLGPRKRLLKAILVLREGTPPSLALKTQAERRQLTVMFCDLVGSTALSVQLDPEDLRVVIGAYHRCCAGVIEGAGGFVAKYMGDGVLAYFGYPRADEHDAERAVRAGLDLVEAVAGLDTAAGTPLQVRVGIATGVVVVGDLIGQGAAQEQAVVGETPNLAARLQALAEPGTVVIAPSTRRLAAGLFDYEDLGAVEIKGFAAPVIASRVLRDSGAVSRFEARHGPDLTPLVGRDEELAVLQRRWQEAKAGEGCVMLLSGEPGIGKSRLVQALLEQLSGEQHTRLRLFCSPHHQNSALYPTITQLERAAGFRRGETAEQRIDKLEAVLAQATGDLSQAAPLLAKLLSVPVGERYPPLRLTPQKQKERTLEALMAQVEGLATRGPVLMLFEDAHWSDPTSLELLDLIIDQVPALRLLLIVTFRPEFTPPWTGRPHVAALSLSRLAPRQRAEMIVGIIGGKALPRQISDQIIERTDGVPLFVEELTKAVLDSGILTNGGNDYDAAGSVPALSIPASLQASLLSRLDRLGPVREVAQIGAALGRQFSHELIGAVTPMPQSQLDAALAQLVGAELIYRRGTPPDTEYTFKHALVQDAAYSTLLRDRRRQLHARIAAILEGQFSDIVATQPALLAHHCTEAGLTDEAIAYWLAAGRQAWGRSMMPEAVALLRRGLALVPALPDTDCRPEREFDLQIALSQALTASRSWGTAELAAVHARARELAVTMDRPRALLFGLWGQFSDHCARADLKRARGLAAELRGLGETAGDTLIQVMGNHAQGVACFSLGEFNTAQAYIEKSLLLYDAAYHPSYSQLLSHDVQVLFGTVSSWLFSCLGHLDQALLQGDAALNEARRLSHAPTLALALGAVTWFTGSFVGFEPGSLLRYADELLALATEHGLLIYRTAALIWRGWCLAALGRADEGIPLMIAGLAGSDELGFMLWRPFFLTSLGDAQRMTGQWHEALRYFAEAQRSAEETGARFYLAETLRQRGDVFLALGDRTGAEASYREAIGLAQRQSAKLWELRGATSLARLWLDQAKRTEAHELLAPVCGWFAEGFGTPVVQEARALLDALH